MDNDRLRKLILAGGKVPPQNFNIDAVESVIIDASCNVDLTGSKIKAIANDKEKYAILTLRGDGITIVGGEFIGERHVHKGTEGQWGMGIKIHGAHNVNLQNIIARDCWGDGFYLGNGCTDIRIEACQAVGNRRQGMSIVDAHNVYIRGNLFADTKGTLPQDGIDIEPDKDCVVENVTIVGNEFRNNAGAHIEVAGKRGSVHRVSITTNRFDGRTRPTKIGGVANASVYQPSLLTRLFGEFGIYTKWPKEAIIP